MASIVNYMYVGTCVLTMFFKGIRKRRSKPRSGKDKNKVCKSCLIYHLSAIPHVENFTMLLKIYLWGTSERHLANMGLPGCQPKSSVHSEKRLQPSLQGQTSPNQNPTSQKWICRPPQEQLPVGGFVFLFRQTGEEFVKVQSYLAFYNCLFLVPKLSKKLQLILDLNSMNKLLKVQNFK